MAARVFGTLFVISFLSYGFGSGFIESITNETDILGSIYANKTQFVIGISLMALVHTFANVGLSVAIFPILKPINSSVSYGYFVFALTATVLLVLGSIFLALLIPLSDMVIDVDTQTAPYLTTIVLLLKQGNFYSYQIGMAIWGAGGLALSYLLLRSKLVPTFVSIWGLLGYVIFIAGTILELFGYEYGLMLSAPGGLFEIFLSLWLIIKGFNFSVSPKLAPAQN